MNFPPTSRYYNIGTGILKTADGRTVAYLLRRFVPQPEEFALLQEYVVSEGDRLDNISSRTMGDPEQFWRICDANRAMRPDELVLSPGRRLRITLPKGIPGTPNV